MKGKKRSEREREQKVEAVKEEGKKEVGREKEFRNLGLGHQIAQVRVSNFLGEMTAPISYRVVCLTAAPGSPGWPSGPVSRPSLITGVTITTDEVDLHGWQHGDVNFVSASSSSAVCIASETPTTTVAWIKITTEQLFHFFKLFFIFYYYFAGNI